MPATKKVMDFEKVKESGLFNPKHRPAGEYVMKITAVDDHTSKEGNTGWVFTCVVASDPKSARPATYAYYCGDDEKNAWKIRKLFIACGRTVPKKRVMVDPNKLVGQQFGAVLDDDEYEGRMKSTIVETIPVDEIVENNADDDEDAYEEEEVEETPPPRKRAPAKKTTRRAAPVEDDDDDDVDDEPPPRRVAKKAPVKKATARRRPEPEDDDDDDEVDDLEIDEL